MSYFKNNNSCLAVVAMKDNNILLPQRDEYVLMLDKISDPGNLGTIIRICDWYGVKKIICSQDTADFYNPKVIAASMGSFTRVSLYYTNLIEYIKNIQTPVYASCLDGENFRNIPYNTEGILIIGNESAGISKDLYKYITHKISIPKYGHAESLNAAVATGIMCDYIMSRKNQNVLI